MIHENCTQSVNFCPGFSVFPGIIFYFTGKRKLKIILVSLKTWHYTRVKKLRNVYNFFIIPKFSIFILLVWLRGSLNNQKQIRTITFKWRDQTGYDPDIIKTCED
jgi:hypothetical protein